MDIYRAANYLIKEHGDQAAKFVTRWANHLGETGDIEGQRKWLQVVKVVEALKSTDRGDASLH